MDEIQHKKIIALIIEQQFDTTAEQLEAVRKDVTSPEINELLSQIIAKFRQPDSDVYTALIHIGAATSDSTISAQDKKQAIRILEIFNRFIHELNCISPRAYLQNEALSYCAIYLRGFFAGLNSDISTPAKGNR